MSQKGSGDRLVPIGCKEQGSGLNPGVFLLIGRTAECLTDIFLDYYWYLLILGMSFLIYRHSEDSYPSLFACGIHNYM